MEQITIVLATTNQGKTEEIRDLLKDSPIIIKNLTDFGPIPPVMENGSTFDENAYIKSSFTARVLGIPAIADDSGLVVEALDGKPGVHSARYAGENATDEEKCQKLLKEMKGKENRNAAFECVISIAVPGGPALTYEGKCKGTITKEPAGSNGFGYDPIFYYEAFDKTFAQLTKEEKNEVSHRGKALKEIKNESDKIIEWIKMTRPELAKFKAENPTSCPGQ